MGTLAKLPEAPYYAVIFTSLRTSGHDEEYTKVDDIILDLVVRQDGYLGVESTRDQSGYGITISYWRDRIAVLNWKRNAEHAAAQAAGMDRFYEWYGVKVCKVEKAYEFGTDHVEQDDVAN